MSEGLYVASRLKRVWGVVLRCRNGGIVGLNACTAIALDVQSIGACVVERFPREESPSTYVCSF